MRSPSALVLATFASALTFSVAAAAQDTLPPVPPSAPPTAPLNDTLPPPPPPPSQSASTPPAAASANAASANDSTTAGDLGDTGTFVVDQVSGFRGRVGGGVSYYGPLGIAYNSFTTSLEPEVSSTGTSASITTTDTKIKSWSIWLAPSLDYFVAKNVSVGGLFALDTSFGSARVTRTTVTGEGGTRRTDIVSDKADLPNIVSFTLLPRVGYIVRINDRMSIWPRFGIGYFSGARGDVLADPAPGGGLTTYTRTTTISSLIMQLDVGFVYQLTDHVFFRAAPAITFSSSGTGSLEYKGTNGASQSGDGSVFQFELSSGFGANFTL